jgi:hypothetical protein
VCVFVCVHVTFVKYLIKARLPDLNKHREMDWIALTTLLHILPFIYSSSDERGEQFTAITTNYRAEERPSEKYQLLGGEFKLSESRSPIDLT